jgi:hypothetical protein
MGPLCRSQFGDTQELAASLRSPSHSQENILGKSLALCGLKSRIDRWMRLHIGYDGSTIMFSLSGWSRTNCTCYSTWPTYMCLTRSATRLASKEEFALLLKARASDDVIAVNINETTCAVEAFSEGT